MPRFRLDQADVARAAARVFDRERSDIDRLMPVFDNAGIATRHSSVPMEWYFETHGWRERNQRYLANAVELLTNAATEALEEAGRKPSDIDAVVTVSTSGTQPPASMPLVGRPARPAHPTWDRLPIFGLGCAGGVIGLSKRAEMARLAGRGETNPVPGGRALRPHFPPRRPSKATSSPPRLVRDGAAAAVLYRRPAERPRDREPRSHLARFLRVMGWAVEEDGLGVVFSRDIPTLVRTESRRADRFLEGPTSPRRSVGMIPSIPAAPR